MDVRAATRADATHLACLVDIAGEGFAAHFWGGMAAEGQSPFEVGRARALRDTGSFTWRNAHVATIGQEVAGALVGYRIDDPVDLSGLAEAPEMVRPLMELEALAPGHWYVNVLAVFPEHRGAGIGRALLARADQIAADSGAPGMAIIVAGGNGGAARLYARSGYVETARRPLVPFPGYRRRGDWVLMVKPLR